MKHLSTAFLACCLLLLAADPALAELKVTFVNRTDFEIQAVSMQGDGGGMSSTIRVVPGNFCVFTDGNSSELREVHIDAGLMLFTFTDMAALAGNASPTLELTFDADNRPHLTLVDKPGHSDGEGAAGSLSLDLPAGPIWNNDHAKERCPQVLEEWLTANPGREAEWTGNWVTVTQGEMSVCSITIRGEHSTLPADAVPSLINVVGTATLFADPANPAKADFAAVIRAGSMGELRAMGAHDAQLWDSQVFLPAVFAGKTWAVFVEPDEGFSREDAVKPGVCMLRTYTGGEQGLARLMQSLAKEGYRPWFAQHTAGENMDTQAMIKFWEEDLSAQDAWEQVADAATDINQGGSAAAVDAILLADEGYARVAAGEDAAIPGLRLRVSNAAVVILQYMPDISSLISMTR